jgi:hypothetical protein
MPTTKGPMRLMVVSSILDPNYADKVGLGSNNDCNVIRFDGVEKLYKFYRSDKTVQAFFADDFFCAASLQIRSPTYLINAPVRHHRSRKRAMVSSPVDFARFRDSLHELGGWFIPFPTPFFQCVIMIYCDYNFNSFIGLNTRAKKLRFCANAFSY